MCEIEAPISQDEAQRRGTVGDVALRETKRWSGVGTSFGMYTELRLEVAVVAANFRLALQKLANYVSCVSRCIRNSQISSRELGFTMLESVRTCKTLEMEI